MTVTEGRQSASVVDQGLVARIHRAVGEMLTERRSADDSAGRVRLSRADERALSRKLIADELRRLGGAGLAEGRAPLSEDDEVRVADAVFDRLHGLAGIQPLLDDPDVRDIHISGADRVWLTRRDGRKERAPSVAPNDEELIELIATAARRIGRSERRWDFAHPELNLQLPNGDRLHALMAVTGRPTITIRRHDFRLSRLAELQRLGVVDDVMTDFLAASVRAKCNVIVAGGTGTGKTTLLRCLINEIDASERIITIEDSLEIGLEHFVDLHPDQETIESRDPNTEGVGEFSMSDGVRAALRMDPDRVIVGEVRGAEVLPMLLAMSQGNDGSMCSIHADSSKGVFGRLAMYAAMTRERLDPDVTNLLVANAVDLIVHIGWIGGVRRATSIREVVGVVEGGHVVSNELWRPGRDGRAVPGAPATEATLDRLADHGFERARLLGAAGRWAAVSALVSLVVGGAVGLGVLLVVAGLAGRTVLPTPTARSARRGEVRLRALAAAVLVGIAVVGATHWPVGGVLAALASYSLPRILGGRAAREGEVARTEAVASWTEMVRDSIVAASGLEEAITATGPIAPEAIRAEVTRLVSRLSHMSLPDALGSFGEELRHPSADLVVAALTIAARMEASDLSSLLSRLAESIRGEARMRIRVEVGRARVRTATKVIVGVVAATVMFLAGMNREYLSAYDSAVGQVVLLIVAGIFATGGWLLVTMAGLELPDRFRARTREALG